MRARCQFDRDRAGVASHPPTSRPVDIYFRSGTEPINFPPFEAQFRRRNGTAVRREGCPSIERPPGCGGSGGGGVDVTMATTRIQSAVKKR